MGLKTKIEYLAKGGSTHNFWYGCTKESEGCRNCFAERMYKRFWGKDFSKIVKSKNFDAPLKWKKPRVILVNDMSDFFHEDVPVEWQLSALEIMIKCEQHIFLLLTKRAKNIYQLFANIEVANKCFEGNNRIKIIIPRNIWLGVSVENQKTADERIPELLKIPHFKKWISFEPLLGMIDVSRYLHKINWAIVGGETGIGARPMQADWARYIRDHCNKQGVPFFMKQMSSKAPIPKDLMVREYPHEIKELINANDKV